jgi:hypothetical protein
VCPIWELIIVAVAQRAALLLTDGETTLFRLAGAWCHEMSGRASSQQERRGALKIVRALPGNPRFKCSNRCT